MALIVPRRLNQSAAMVRYAGNISQVLGAQTLFVRTRALSTAATCYAFSQCSATGTNGIRFQVNATTAWLFGADSSGTSIRPSRASTAGTITAGKVQTCAVTWDGGIDANNIHIYTAEDDGPLALNDGTATSGTTAINPPTSSTPIIIGNRSDVARNFQGDIFDVARWNRTLTVEELQAVRKYGAAAVPNGLVFDWHNGTDWGSYHLQAPFNDASSFWVAGPTSPFAVRLKHKRRPRYAPGFSVGGSPYFHNLDIGVFGVTGFAASLEKSATGPIIDYSSMQTSVTSSSTYTTPGGVDTFTLDPRLTVNETEGASWTNVCVKVTGVSGMTPKFVISTANIRRSWTSNQHGFFSYDGLTWTQMGNAPVISSTVTCQHTLPFTQDTVWFARERKEGVAQIGAWITSLAAAYPSLIGYLAGQSSFICDTFSTQSQAAPNARTIVATPLYGFKISSGGTGKWLATLISGVHSGEEWGTTVYRKAIEFLLGSSTEAQNLRANFDFICLPLMNAPGREGGHTRAQFEVKSPSYNDLNRHFVDTPPVFETVDKTTALLNANVPNGDLVAHLDYHTYGGSGSTRIGHYTCGDALSAEWIAAINARLTSANQGGTPGNSTDTWAQARGALLANYYEQDTAAPSTDADAVTNGEASIRALNDLLVAGDFGAVNKELALVSGGYSVLGYSALLSRTTVILDYPAFPALEGSKLERRDERPTDFSVSGKLRQRSVYSRSRVSIKMRHRLTEAQYAQLQAFYASRRMVNFRLTWRGTEYTVRFLAPPTELWVGGSAPWQVETTMSEM